MKVPQTVYKTAKKPESAPPKLIHSKNTAEFLTAKINLGEALHFMYLLVVLGLLLLLKGFPPSSLFPVMKPGAQIASV